MGAVARARLIRTRFLRRLASGNCSARSSPDVYSRRAIDGGPASTNPDEHSRDQGRQLPEHPRLELGRSTETAERTPRWVSVHR